MSDLERLHAAAWQTRGNGGHFIADDGFATFWRAIIPRLIRKGMVWFTFYELGGERIAGAQGFIVGETCCGYIAGRSLGRTLQTLGIGKAATAQCIAAAIRRRCSVFDFLGGGHDYKRRLGAEQNFIARMVVYPKGVKRAAVVVLLIALRVRFFFRVIAWQSIVGEVARRGFGPKA
jgi:CelD/BcsL family acetyltransferase involved in cellulose biosynthesis